MGIRGESVFNPRLPIVQRLYYHPRSMLSVVIRALILVVCLAGFAESAPAERRVALVIGNSDYVSVPKLDNPRNDATNMAQKLRDLGFSVTLLLDLDKAGFEQRLREFAGSLSGADAAVFFYAGHGLQVDGRNYLVPVDANVSNEADLPFQLVALDIALQRLADQRITSIVILDACRNNPLSDQLAKAIGDRSNAVSKGLANIYAGVGTLISFSTQPGNVALDGAGADSPFTEALLQHIANPNVDVLAMMREVRRDVVTRTDNQQVPWDNSSLISEFYFAKMPDAKLAANDQDGSGTSTKPHDGDQAADQGTNTSGGEETGGGREDNASEHAASKPAEDNPIGGEEQNGEVDISHVIPPENHPSADHHPDEQDQPILTGRAPVTLCDTVAASATDPLRVTDGVSFGELDGKAGVKACRAALAKYPNTERFSFQLARSLQKAGDYGEAAALYGALVARGYFAALVNYGWLLNNGQGVAQDQRAAVKYYLLAASQGDMLGMFNVAMAYDSGEGLPYNPAQAAAWIYAALRLGHDYSIKQMSGPADGWTREFRIALQRLLKQAGVYSGPLDGVFGPAVWHAVQTVETLPYAPDPGGAVPLQRFDPRSIPVNAPLPR